MKYLAERILKKLLALRTRLILRKKIRKMAIKSDAKVDPSEHIQKWRRLTRWVDPSWFNAYFTMSGVPDASYVPEDIYNTIIEPVLNDRVLGLMFSNKNLYDLNYPLYRFPKVLLHNIHGAYLDAGYRIIKGDPMSYCNEDKIIVKPSLDSGGGKGVELFMKARDGKLINDKNEELTIPYLDKKFKKNFVVQSYFCQHPYYSRLNETSVNTVKIAAYRSVSTNEITALYALLRIGKDGSFVDNINAGGIFCMIGKDGRLFDFGMDKNGKKHYSFNGKTIRNIGKVHKIDEMRDVAVKIAEKNYYSRIISVDLSVSEKEEVTVIEINNQFSDVNIYQMHGFPYFGRYSEEIIKHCGTGKGLP